MVNKVVKDFPNIKVVGTTLRGVKTATVNDWSAIMWSEGQFYDGAEMPALEIKDRVGGGDGFASGFTYGFLTASSRRNAWTLASPTARCLMSTRGDTSQITLDELNARRRRRQRADQAVRKKTSSPRRDTENTEKRQRVDPQILHRFHRLVLT